MTTETSIDASTAPAAAPGPGATVASNRYRAAAGVVIVAGLGVIVGTLLALDVLRGYQVVLNVVGGGALAGTAALLLKGRGRALAVTLTWLAAFGVMCEGGDHQAQINDTGALAATNTEYFLPVAYWIALAVLFLAAIGVTVLTKRVRGDA